MVLCARLIAISMARQADYYQRVWEVEISTVEKTAPRPPEPENKYTKLPEEWITEIISASAGGDP